MPRPSKKTPELEQQFVEYIHQGRTIEDACRLCGITSTTFTRWRNLDPFFNKAVMLAGQRQWEYLEQTKRNGYRTYTKNWSISEDYDDNVKQQKYCPKIPAYSKSPDTPKPSHNYDHLPPIPNSFVF